ncbi:MAG: YqjK family protein [Ottowia sp.]|nr:hypothetical protein [Ottowia sp.]
MSPRPSSPAALQARRRLLLQRSDRLRRRIASDAPVLAPGLGAVDRVRSVVGLVKRHRGVWLGAAALMAAVAVSRPRAAGRLGRGVLTAWELAYGGRALLRRAAQARR